MSEYKGFTDWKKHDNVIEGHIFKQKIIKTLIKLNLHPEDPLAIFLEEMRRSVGIPDKIFISPKQSKALQKIKKDK